MTYLLDVNVLISLGLQRHEFHNRVSSWVAGLSDQDRLATTPLTELGFIRIIPQLSSSRITLAEARAYLKHLKSAKARPWVFLVDDHSIDRLPKWVSKSNQTTDGHLAGLAAAHGAILATVDERIPGTLLIPP